MKKITQVVSIVILLALFGADWISHSQERWPIKPIAVSQHHPKIESALEILAQTPPPSRALGLTPRQSAYFQPSDQTVRVIIEPEGKNAQAIDPAQLGAVGAVVEARSRSLLRVRVPLKNLRALAETVENIRFVRRALPMVATAANKVSEGVVGTGASLFHSQGFKGQRVRVAIIDLGFSQLARAKQNMTLPFDVVIDETDYSGSGLEAGTAHGTAVAEIVHDMAPEAWLYLKKATDEVELELAVDDAIAQGIQIINYSVGVANSNFNDGTGLIDEIVDRAHAAGILWVNAAGNHARSHWMGRFTDTDHNGWNEFLPGQEELNIQVQSFFPIQIYLTWDDWPVSAEDYDLLLYDAAGNLVASSQGNQTGTEMPTEDLEYMPQGVGIYQLKILARYARRPGIRLNLFVFGEHPLSPFVPESSILAPADAKGALAVGAISARNWKTGPQEDYSSLGPTFDGRIKPDVSGPDQVTNWALFNFGGTSAAAPHVAGAAALLLSRDPRLTADELQAQLESLAIEMGEPGKDNIYGAGRLELSFGPISARRTVREITHGRSYEIEIALTMPVGLFGLVELIEQVPKGFSLKPLDNNGAQFQLPKECLANCYAYFPEYRWVWVLGSSEIRRIRYRLEVDPFVVSQGLYALVGYVNGERVQGDFRIRVTGNASVTGNARQIELLSSRGIPPVKITVLQRRPTLRFRTEGDAFVKLRVFVYDLTGRLLFDEAQTSETLEFSGLDRSGRPLPTGVYFYLVMLRDQTGHLYRSRLERFVLVR